MSTGSKFKIVCSLATSLGLTLSACSSSSSSGPDNSTTPPPGSHTVVSPSTASSSSASPSAAPSTPAVVQPIVITSTEGYKISMIATLTEQPTCLPPTDIPPGQKCVIAAVTAKNLLTDRPVTAQFGSVEDAPWTFGAVDISFPKADGQVGQTESSSVPTNTPKGYAFGLSFTCPFIGNPSSGCTGEDVGIQANESIRFFVELPNVPAAAKLADFRVVAGAGSAPGVPGPGVEVPLTH